MAGDATRDHPPPSDACHPRPPSLPPPPPFDSVPEKSLPQSPSPPLPASPKPPSSHLRAKNPIPPPSIPPLHAPEAPTGCDSFPRRQRIPNLLRLSARRGQSNSAGHLFSDIHRYPVDHTLPTGLPYPRYRFEEPCPRSSQETEAGHCFPPTFEELVTCRWLLAAPSWRQNVFSGKAWWGVMGAFCSCLQADYSDHHGNQASGALRNCMCLRCFTQQLINAYTVLFRVGTVHAVSQAIEATPIDSSESSFDTYRSPPRPLPYDDPRFSPPLRDWFASRHDASSHSPEESEPLRADFDEEMETMSSVDKPSKTNYDTKMKRGSSAYGDKLSRKESGNYYTYFSPSAEDEDVCPTCLEDYTSENPRIVMQCSHHFHLGCIYEWMERSEACPVCGKKMEFNETT